MELSDVGKYINQKRSWFDRAINILFFVAIYVILFLVFTPNLLFSATTTCGGDMGSHNYVAKFFIEELLPKFKLSGWSMLLKISADICIGYRKTNHYLTITSVDPIVTSPFMSVIDTVNLNVSPATAAGS